MAPMADRIYTRTGDDGGTSLRDGRRVAKAHPRLEACGALDELSSALGAAASVLPRRRAFAALHDSLERCQACLLEIGAELAAPKGSADNAPFPEDGAVWLETEIDKMTAELPPLKRFILPGGASPAAFLHLARAICRRAERAVCALGPEETSPGALRFINRLSDFLFTAARWSNARLRGREQRWKAAR